MVCMEGSIHKLAQQINLYEHIWHVIEPMVTYFLYLYVC